MIISGGPTPREPTIPRVLGLEKGTGTSLRSEPVPFSIEAPRREPGGRRAVGRETTPEAHTTVHHHDAQNAITTNNPRHFYRRTAGRWATGAGAGGDMLESGGFCYRMPVWPIGTRS